MESDDCETSLYVREGDLDVSIEPSGSDERLVERLGNVGSTDQDLLQTRDVSSSRRSEKQGKKGSEGRRGKLTTGFNPSALNPSNSTRS